jgi:LytS/YehU family sensor histidine kinase
MSIQQVREEFIFKSSGAFLIALVIGFGIYVYESYRDHVKTVNLQIRTHQLEKERALKQASEARLASLESKLHPHFLFNTLNSISALISEDPALADKMVQRLASLLRNSLDACEQESVSLADEIRLVTDYLEIEKTRFRERLTYKIEVTPQISASRVPPMILLPVVENSVKFAVATALAGGTIRISARRFGRQLLFEVRDNGPGFASDMLPAGHGLDNLQSRLTALYGDTANLSVRSGVGETVVAVTMPITENDQNEQ